MSDSDCFLNASATSSIVNDFQVLMYYQDRLSHLGYTNWGNLMVMEQEGRLAFAVAIDQSIEISKPLPTLMSIDPFARIQTILKDIPQAALDIWEDIPSHFKCFIEEEVCLQQIQAGMEEGFHQIATLLTPEVLRSIDQELSSGYTTKDFVCVKDLIKAQQMIVIFLRGYSVIKI